MCFTIWIWPDWSEVTSPRYQLSRSAVVEKAALLLTPPLPGAEKYSLICVILRTLTIDEENQLVGLRSFAPTYHLLMPLNLMRLNINEENHIVSLVSFNEAEYIVNPLIFKDIK